MPNEMRYCYSFLFNEAKVFEYALNKTNAQRAALTPPLSPLTSQEFFDILIQEQLATFTNSFRDAVLQKVSEKLQEVFMSDSGDPAVQKTILDTLGLLNMQF